METMELPAQEILDCLKMSGRRFQTKAVRDARSSKETITPHLLARLAEVAENPDGFTEGDFSHLYSTFLLAEFREHLAFPLLIQILRLPGKEIENLFPLEFITESAHLILASVFNGDLKALQDLYDDKTIYSDCRIAGIKAIFCLLNEGVLSEEVCSTFLREKLAEAIKKEDIESVTTIVEGVLHCDLSSLKDLSDEAFNKDVVDTFEIEWNDSIFEIENGRSSAYRLTNSTESEMGWWACFET